LRVPLSRELTRNTIVICAGIFDCYDRSQAGEAIIFTSAARACVIERCAALSFAANAAGAGARIGSKAISILRFTTKLQQARAVEQNPVWYIQLSHRRAISVTTTLSEMLPERVVVPSARSSIAPLSFLHVAAAAMLILGLASCGDETESYRYKLTLAVNTPDGVKRASSVGEVRYRKVSVPERGTMYKLQGEALYLDLGLGAKPLLALLTSRLESQLRPKEVKDRSWQLGKAGWSPDGGPASVLLRIYGLARSENFMADVARMARMRGPRAITLADMPDLVTFADINEPKSVIEVDPNDLQATLGPNITWNEITLESTDEPITRSIRTKLPWLPKYVAENLRLDGSQLGGKREIANILSWADFERD
jgi:hypothetical protein